MEFVWRNEIGSQDNGFLEFGLSTVLPGVGTEGAVCGKTWCGVDGPDVLAPSDVKRDGTTVAALLPDELNCVVVGIAVRSVGTCVGGGRCLATCAQCCGERSFAGWSVG